nr:AAA family ATPase [Thiocystis violacea]
MAHLLYGAGESGGFVLLTGEVGTGKTTVCRAFLEQLPEDVDVALILNPAQSATELLTNVCEEFRIPLPPGKRSNKMLIDRLNEYLLTAHANGRRPLLIIDEAQNLLPQAMEQIRLLTNLETTKQKLLQIFLIGQPELRRLLERDRLRQLDQRITARFHLTPFNLRECGDYIRHRVAVAGVDRPLFSSRAIRRIYRYSGGIPRLINILCDRALLGVCVTRGSQVSPAIVAKAAREVRGDPIEAPARSPLRLAMVALLSFGLAAAVGLWAHSTLKEDPREILSLWFQEGPEAPTPAETPESSVASPGQPEASTTPIQADVAPTPDGGHPPDPLVEPAPPAAVGESSVPPLPMPEPLALESRALPESEAMRLLLRRWGLDPEAIGREDPCADIRILGLSCEPEQGRLSHVRFFNLPVLLRVLDSDGASRYLVLGALEAGEATLDFPGGPERVPLESLERVWTGDYSLIWQRPPGGASLIGAGSSGEDVRWLRALLAKVPGLGMRPGNSARFDADLVSALRAFQASKGLMPDGIAGPRTIIVLQHAVGVPGLPRLDGGPASAQPGSGAP